MRRQFCSMAREFGFASATDFALVVGSWTQEQRRNCLDAFYRRREARLLEMEGLVQVKKDDEGDGDGTNLVKKEEGVLMVESEDIDVRAEEEADVKDERVRFGGPRVKDEDTTPSSSWLGLKEVVKAEGKKEDKGSSIFLYDDEDDDDEL